MILNQVLSGFVRIWAVRFSFVALAILIPFNGSAQNQEQYCVEDKFDGGVKYFFEGEIGASKYRYLTEEQAYEIDGLQSDKLSIAVLTDEFRDYEIEADVEIAEGKLGKLPYAGLVFHYRESPEGKATYYALVFTQDYSFGVMRVEQEESRGYPFPMRESLALNPGGFNTLKVRVRDKKAEIFVNGKFVGEFWDDKLAGGGAGFLAGAGTRARFKSFRWKILEQSYERLMSGTFGFIPLSKLKAVFRDDFKKEEWKTGNIDGGRLYYEDNGYVIDNLRGSNLLISFREPAEVSEGVFSMVFKEVEGSEGNGFGLAFNVQEEPILRFRAFVIARDGTYKLFEQSGETVKELTGWKELPFDVDFAKPVALTAVYLLEDSGLRVVYGVNGRIIGDIFCEDANLGNGIGVVGAPGIKVKVSYVTFFALENGKSDFLAQLERWKARKQEEGNNDDTEE